VSNFYPFAREALFRLPPETAHEFSLKSLNALYRLPVHRCFFPGPIQAPISLMGLRFPNRVGLAAGLDKNGAYIDPLGALGFGFVEVGTVTPLPQPGNPKPRLFRLPEHRALINRFGFNNAGMDTFIRNIQRSQWQKKGGILGLNIGKNAQTPMQNATEDYLIGLRAVYPYADYVSVNVSSPNTENLRELQQEKALDSLLNALHKERLALKAKHQRYVPLVVKIAPDLSQAQIDHIATMIQSNQFNGVIATNTTVKRAAVQNHRYANEKGGLSGPPVHTLSLKVIERLRQQLGDEFPIIGVGGIEKGQDALEKIQAGANAVQLFTGLIYRGPSLIAECVHRLK